ncbi:MAG: 1,4-alpha-glucan branching enzyme GlgB [Chlamydiae bacterium]|nr:1,4-alpha-glucan branching enzyme GlgB [Chlamydiota bacterium]
MNRTNPHQQLGLHKEGRLIRLWRKGASELQFELKGERVQATPTGGEGLFEYALGEKITLLDYRITHPSGELGHDPYAFLPTLSPEDEALLSKGKHWRIYEVLGGRLCTHQGCNGVKFSVWAPCAKSVALVGDFNRWDVEINPMRLMGASGIWELFVPGLLEGERYKFAIETREGEVRFKADPLAFQGEMRPNTASVVNRVDSFEWSDQKWMESRKRALDRPMNIYEVHLGSWNRGEFEFLGYREIAPRLAEYLKKMGYTHVELMPVMGHPLDESWGYQVTGFYAISRRYGTIQEFQYFVDTLHSHGIGVILDWVPGHFPTDDHSIAHFDGTSLYEHVDPRQGFHPHWKTHIFNYGRYEVSNFLIGSALFYLDKMHIDGLRVDAVSSMVYLDFAGREGEWVANSDGGNENFEAINLLKELNRLVHEIHPGVVMIAEESHAFPKVTAPEGLGFDLKWDLGWMNDTLRFFETPMEERHHLHKILVHEFTYYFEERHILPLSHDEVVHCKKSLLSKMPGNEWQKFANLRLLLSYMICHPGKKLLFMGGEFGQWLEWDCKEELHWDVLQMPFHQKLQECATALNRFYREHPALWEDDFSRSGWEWVDMSDERNSVLAYLRKGREERLLCVHHFSASELTDYLIPLKGAGEPREIFSTDSQEYGGSGIMNPEIASEKEGIRLSLPPLSTLIIKI